MKYFRSETFCGRTSLFLSSKRMPAATSCVFNFIQSNSRKGSQMCKFYKFFPSYRWHATKCSGLTSRRRGFSFLQMSMHFGQRPANLHPGGTLIGDGTSPSILILLFCLPTCGSGTGIAEINACVYGCKLSS